jgi:hypothetical protein
MSLPMRTLFVGCAFCFFTTIATTTKGQSTNEQLWLEYMLNVPFANSFNLENAFVYSTLFESPRWYSLDYTPTLEYSIIRNIDLSAATTLAYTLQVGDYNTFEVRPVIGTRIHFTPNRRVVTRLYLRGEQRNFLNLDSHEWQTTYRSRIRAECLVAFNRRDIYQDKLWYGVGDVEWLFTNEDVQERFANRFRARIGIGYRLNQSSRFEFLFMNQESRNGIDDTFSSTDLCFRFRYKHFLRKHKASRLSGSGN